MDLSGPGIDVKLKERKKERPQPTTSSVIFLPHKFFVSFLTNKIRKILEFSFLFFWCDFE
jgi:hypothetical protein